MNNKFIETLASFLFIFGLTSCEYEAVQSNPSSPDNILAKIDTDDKEVQASDEDLKCVEDNDCVLIDKGCCQREKLIAVNKSKSFPLIQKRSSECKDLRKEKQQALDTERQEKAKALAEARKAKDKAEQSKILKKMREKFRETRHDLCYGRLPLGGAGDQIAQCIACKCEVGSVSASPPPLGEKCIAAKNYLLENRPAMLKALADAKSSDDKKTGVELWNKLTILIQNAQECACEKYSKELEEIVKKLKPAEEAK